MANQEHFDILKQGVKVWNSWRQAHPDIKPDLSSANLWKADLEGADLSGVNLKRADLEGADLSGVNLKRAILYDANLREAILRGTDLRWAHIQLANLSGADLSETDLRGAILSLPIPSGTDPSEAAWRRVILKGANLSGANLRGLELINFDLREIDLHQSDLSGANLSNANFSGTNLSNANFSGANLSNANLSRANLSSVNLREINLSGVNLREANLSGADLSNADLRGKDLNGADLSNAILRGADLSGANLSEIILIGADLSKASLIRAIIVEANLQQAILNECLIYGISAWDVRLEGAKQEDLIITLPNHPIITIDNLKVAQFIYLLLNNAEIRDVIDTIAKKAILILGRFTAERKVVLNALRKALRTYGYVPILFDFDKPSHRSLTETVRTLAHLARFIIADLTDPSSIPQELQAIIPTLAVPVQPVLLDGKREYSMFVDFLKTYHWVLPIHYYADQNDLLTTLEEYVIVPAEQKAKELEKR